MTSTRSTEAKTIASINDNIVITPQKTASIQLLLDQTNLPNEAGLYRDHQSPNDPWFAADEEISLSEGSSFYTGEPPCRASPPVNDVPAKYVVTVNDHPEYTNRREQTGASLRRLFDLDDDVELLIDTMSPNDIVIADEDPVDLGQSNVLITRDRNCDPLRINIIVNARPKVATKCRLSYREIVELAFPNPNFATQVFTVTYCKGPRRKPEDSLSDGDTVKIVEGMEFNVTQTNKS
ncbi:multiubiquitin domain-containing protein [Coraliomargarita sp. SDUM461003]|uniref:Multiubiquitin domain-containing protein n=1 Tax=Thalassobacterium maritimum TaxID=3041265 RepID=A0ABU1B0M6_9BACT|nr:multiubiquitin domain-containing protein [Coraliomargarita sp. SDUM461003]MDQ8208822.1 multiubiquitin domain-containing protein [Coraliomargarita sp. SDUM461003]